MKLIQKYVSAPRSRPLGPSEPSARGCPQTLAAGLSIDDAPTDAGGTMGGGRERRPPGRRLYGTRVIRLCLLLAVFMGLCATPVQAHDLTLVGNFDGFSPDGRLVVGDDNSGGLYVQEVAQRFSTGSAVDGYWLKSVKFRVHYYEGSNAVPRVFIYTATSTGPSSTSIGTLSGSVSGTGDVTFTASGNGVSLDANTTYFIYFEDSNTSATPRHHYSLRNAADADDDAAQPGWSIDFAYKRIDEGNWEKLTGRNPLAVEIKGDVKNHLPQGEPRVFGSPVLENVALGVVTSGITDEDGLTNVSYTYQWMRRSFGGTDTEISGATSSSYTPGAADVGQRLRVMVNFTDDDGYSHSLLSSVSAYVQAACPSGYDWCSTLTVGELIISSPPGTAYGYGETPSVGSLVDKTFEREGTTYTVNRLRYNDFDSGTDTVQIYLSDSVPIDSVFRLNRTRFTVNTGNQIGTGIYVWGRPSGLNWASGQKVTVSVVTPDPNNPATGAPTITGAPQVGQTLTAGTSGISDADGLTNVSYAYQWIRVDGASENDISGATFSAYTPVAADQGKKIKVKVSFTDDRSFSETLTSVETAAVARMQESCATDRAGAHWCATMTVGTVTQSPFTYYGYGPLSGGYGTLDDTTFEHSGASYTVSRVRLTDLPIADSVQIALNAFVPRGSVFNVGGTEFTATVGSERTTVGIYQWDVATDFGWRLDGQKVTVSVKLFVTKTAPTGAPTITGALKTGFKLTADTSGISDANGLTSPGWTFQWVRVDGGTETDITGATSRSYELTADDVGKKLKVKVSFTDDESFSEMLTSAETATVQGCNDEVRLIHGDVASEGSVEYCRNNEWRAVCDDSWDKKDADVACRQAGYRGANSHTWGSYFANFVNTQFWLDEVACNGNENSLADCSHPGFGVITSCGYEERAGARCRADAVPAGAPAISGAAQVGQSLTASTSGISDADGTTKAVNGDIGFAYTYQWVRVDGGSETDITGATSNTYTLTDEDEGKSVKVKVSFKDDGGKEEGPLESGAYPSSGTVAGRPNRAAAGMPSISGAAQAGQTLTASTDGITDEDGKTKADGGEAGFAYAYQWVRVDGGSETDITGATSNTYTLTNDDEGKTVKVKVSFTDDRGNAEGPLESPVTGTIASDGSNDPPVFSDGASATRSIAETAGDAVEQNARDVGNPVSATDGDAGDTLVYTLAGTDAEKFDIVSSSGQVRTKAGERYDHEEKASYALTVTVSNDTVNVSIGVTVDVTNDANEPPIAPAAPGAAADGVSVLDVAWSAPANTGRPQIASYDLQYRAGASGSWTNGPQDVTRLNAEITGLTQDTLYQVRVRATNADGDGTWSLPGSGRTGSPGASMFRFGASAYTAAEGGDVAMVSVRLSPPLAAPVTLDLSATGQNGATEADWSGVPASLTFAAGEMSKTFMVTAVDDAENDDGESVVLGFGAPPAGVTIGAPATATVELVDDDAAETPPGGSVPDFAGESLTRQVPENAPAGAAVGEPVAANDPSGGALAYTLEGADGGSFAIDGATGQIRTRAGVDYDHETQASYSVVVRAEDGAGGSAAVRVTIEVADVAEKPATPHPPVVAEDEAMPTSLEATWMKPGLNGGPDITGYDVQYRRGAGGAWTDWPHAGAGLRTRITGLDADAVYEVRVRARNGEMPSEWSAPSTSGRFDALTRAWLSRFSRTAVEHVADAVME